MPGSEEEVLTAVWQELNLLVTSSLRLLCVLVEDQTLHLRSKTSQRLTTRVADSRCGTARGCGAVFFAR